MTTPHCSIKHRDTTGMQRPDSDVLDLQPTHNATAALSKTSWSDDWVDVQAPNPVLPNPHATGIIPPVQQTAHTHDMTLCALQLSERDTWADPSSLKVNTLTRFVAPPMTPLHGLHLIRCTRGIVYFSTQHTFGEGLSGVCRPGVWVDTSGAQRPVCIKWFASHASIHAKREYLAGGYLYGPDDLFFTTPSDGYMLVTDVAHGALDDVRYTGPHPQSAFALALHDILTDLNQLHSKGLLHRDLKCNNVQVFARNGAVRIRLRDFDNTSDVCTPYSVSPMQIAPECLQHPTRIPNATQATLASAEVYTATMMLLGLLLRIDEAGWSRTAALPAHERQACIAYWEALRVGQSCQVPELSAPGLAATFERRWRAIHSLPAPLNAVLGGLLAYAPHARWTAAEALIALGTREDLEASGLIAPQADQLAHWPSQAPVEAALAALRAQLASLPPLSCGGAMAEPLCALQAAQAKREALAHLGVSQPDALLSEDEGFVQGARQAALRAYGTLRRHRPMAVLPILGAGIAMWKMRQVGAAAVPHLPEALQTFEGSFFRLPR